MKKFILFIIFTILPLLAFAAPFGLKMGMTIEEIAAQCEENPYLYKDDCYVIKPVKKHPLFDWYAAYVDEKSGLYKIEAHSSSIETSKYGTELQAAFTNVKDRIAKTYGNPKVKNWLDSSISSYQKGDDYWYYTLQEGSRELSAVWGANASLADNLETVELKCKATSGYLHGDGQLILSYYFANNRAVEDSQDDVF